MRSYSSYRRTEGKFRTVVNWAIPPSHRHHGCSSLKRSLNETQHPKVNCHCRVSKSHMNSLEQGSDWTFVLIFNICLLEEGEELGEI